MDINQVNEQDKPTLAKAAALAGTNVQQAILDAYEAGLLRGAQNVAIRFAQQLASTTPTVPSNTGNDDGDDDKDSPLSDADRAWLRAQGIDPDKKFRSKNSVFTITGVKRSRWKFPVSGVNQNGTRYKFPIASVKSYQAATR